MGALSAAGRAGPIASLLLTTVWALELARMVVDAGALRIAATACLAAFTVHAWFRSSPHIRALFLVIVVACAAMAWQRGSAADLMAGFARGFRRCSFAPFSGRLS